jgi:hypothetical protein
MRGLTFGVAADAGRQQQQIPQPDRAAAFAGRRHAQQPHGLHPAAVGHVQTVTRQFGAQFGQHADHAWRQRDVVRSLRDGAEIFVAQRQCGVRRQPFVGTARTEQRAETGGADRHHRHAHQKAVEEGFTHFVLRHLVGGADHADQRAQLTARTVVEFAFVQQREQRVEDGAVGLEHLVDEGDRRIGQEAVGMTLVAVFFQRADGQRAEQLFGHRKAGEQTLEVAGIAEGAAQAARQFALGGAGRPDQQRVLAGQRGQQAQAHDRAALDQTAFERVDQGMQAGGQCGIHR